MRIDWLEGIARLKRGEVVALPTETVYGLAASLEYPGAIQKLYDVKGRPKSKPFTIHLANAFQVIPLASGFPKGFHELAKRWPGPLTLILPADQAKVPAQVRAGLTTAGFRVPAHPLTLKVLEEVGPCAMPSANLSGEAPAIDPEEIERVFGKDFPIVESGMRPMGTPSTILEYRDAKWVKLR